MGQNLDVLLPWEGHSDLGSVVFDQLWDSLFSGTVDDIAFFCHVKSHMAAEAVSYTHLRAHETL